MLCIGALILRSCLLISAPGPPVRLRFPEVSSSSLKLAWDPPVNPHGNITGYELSWDLESASLSSNTFQLTASTTFFRASVPPSSKRYAFKVRAKTKMGYGDWARALVLATNERRGKREKYLTFGIPYLFE